MNQRFCILATALLASVLLSGCFATSSEQKYGALGGAAGAALCSNSQALLGLCVIGGYVLGSEIGARRDVAQAAQGTTKCKSRTVRRFNADGTAIAVEDGETCESEKTMPGYRTSPR